MKKIQRILRAHKVRKRLEKVFPEDSELAASEELRECWKQWQQENATYVQLADNLKNLSSIDDKERQLLRIKSISDRMAGIEKRILSIRKALKRRR